MPSPLPKEISVSSFVLYFIKKQKILFLILLIGHLGWTIDQIALPYVFKIFIDRIVEYQGDRSVAWSVLAMPVLVGAALWLLVEIMFRIFDYVKAIALPRFEASIRMYMTEYIMDHSHQFFMDRFSGDIGNKISDIVQSASNMTMLVIGLFFPTCVAVLAGTIIFTAMHPSFGAIVSLWFCVHIGICFYYAKDCNDASFKHSESRSALSGKIIDALTNITSIKSFSRERLELKTIEKKQHEEQRKNQKTLMLMYKIHVLQAIAVFSLMGIAMTWYMVYCWQNEYISAGDLTYIFYAGWGLSLMAWVSGIELPTFFKEIGICRQALTLVNLPHQIVDQPGASPLTVSKGIIEFKNVNFKYNDHTEVFENKNITIKAGQKIGLVGYSGSGKSTFVNLIMRFYDINSGAITIDGTNIANITQQSLRENLSLIPQDPSLFHRSLMDNIRYGSPEASDEEVIDASGKAHCHEFISKLPSRYDTLVGERGTRLSGGQRQRIAIARAILKDAPILILDEATSALDSVTEQLIQESLHSLMSKRTTIVVAHRLSTLSEMDRILVFDQGHVIEDGTHSQLLALQGHYARMWSMQAGGFLPEVDDS